MPSNSRSANMFARMMLHLRFLRSFRTNRARRCGAYCVSTAITLRPSAGPVQKRTRPRGESRAGGNNWMKDLGSAIRRRKGCARGSDKVAGSYHEKS